METTIVYVVRDASSEYISGKYAGHRTPASDEAKEFDTIDEARRACDCDTDTILSRKVS